VVSLNGEVIAYHGFTDEKDCFEKQGFMVQRMKGVVRDITICIGVPIKGGKR
jgi:hypothetical protein